MKNTHSKKTLQDKFLDGDELNFVDNLRINMLRRVSDCDGMCGFYQVCNVCEVYKNKITENKKEYKTN